MFGVWDTGMIPQLVFSNTILGVFTELMGSSLMTESVTYNSVCRAAQPLALAALLNTSLQHKIYIHVALFINDYTFGLHAPATRLTVI